MIRVNKQTFSRLWRLIKPFFTSEVRWQGRGLIAVLVIFALSIQGVNVLMSYIARDFMTSLSTKAEAEFYRALLIYLCAFAVSTLVTVFQSYTEQRTGLLWRKTLSRHILKRYFSHMAFYRVGFMEGIDNPDQRLEEDIRSFTSNTLSLFLISFNSFVQFILFVGILGSISFNLVIGALTYAFLGSIIAYLIGRPLISLNFAQLKKEADYRYKLVNVRDNAESIAFYRGDRKELTRTRQRLKVALENSLRIIRLNRNLNFFVTLYNNLKPVLPIVIVSPLFLSGDIKFGVVTQSADAFVRVVESLSVLIQNFGTISGVAAVVSRLGSFTEALDEVTAGNTGSTSKITTALDERIAFENVTVFTPKRDQTLARNLNFELLSGGLLIVGGSGYGKTSILRVLGGLWDSGEGKIFRPPLEESLFLPQRPYLVLGSLRNQLLYCLKRKGVSDRELESVLRQVRLDTAAKRVGGLDAYAHWNNLLSAGEQQQLAFARLLLARPKYAYVDEATTAVDAATEAHLYDMLTRMTTAFISVGYRANLARYHRHILEIRSDGSWHLERQTRGK